MREVTLTAKDLNFLRLLQNRQEPNDLPTETKLHKLGLVTYYSDTHQWKLRITREGWEKLQEENKRK